MDKHNIDFHEFSEKLKYISSGELTEDDLIQVTSFFEAYFCKEKNAALTSDQTECLISLIRYSGNMLKFLDLDQKMKDQKIKAEYILMQEKGRISSKAVQALEVFGVNSKKIKLDRKKRMKALYEKLYGMEPHKVYQDGRMEIDFRISNQNLIEWKTDSEKKMSIIKYLKSEFYRGVTLNAVITELSRLKTDNLPGVKSDRRE